MTTIGSLFSGVGQLDEAVRTVLGGRVIWHAEHEPPSKARPNPSQAAAKILAHHYPGVPNLGDVSAIDWTRVEHADIWTGGFPCPDVSAAGLRAGLRPDTRSGLWYHMAAGIAAHRPRLVVIENVRGLLSADAAHSDLGRCSWCVGDGHDGPRLRALGAVLGDLASLGYDAAWCGLRAADVGAPHARYRVFIVAADAHRVGHDWPAPPPGPGLRAGPADSGQCAGLLPTPRATDGAHGGPGMRGTRGDLMLPSAAAQVHGHDWGQYTERVQLWAALLGRPAPPPTIDGTHGRRKLNPDLVDWMMGWPAGWTDIPGISINDRIRVGGNGVVPAQAAAALRYLLPHLLLQERP